MKLKLVILEKIFIIELNVFEINIKSLNERISDIPLLIKYFSKKISENYNIKELEIDENDSYILNHNWQGNVRELRNLIERIAILQPETKEKISNIIKESLKIDNFNDQNSENSLSVPLKEAREKFEKEYLTIQLKNLMEIYLKQLILLEWKEVLFIENLKV